MADSKSVSAGGNATSDAFTLTATTVAAWIQLKAERGGVPSSGDIVQFRILETLGDPDGAGVDEYSDSEHSTALITLDLNAINGAISGAIAIPPIKAGKIYAENDGSSSASVSGTLWEMDLTGTKTDTQIEWT